TRMGDQIDPESMDALASPRCANVSGFSLHAMSGCECKPDRAQPSSNVCVPAGDRQRLEELQPDYSPVGPDRMAFNDDHACRASVVRRKRRAVAELRRQGCCGGT